MTAAPSRPPERNASIGRGKWDGGNYETSGPILSGEMVAAFERRSKGYYLFRGILAC